MDGRSSTARKASTLMPEWSGVIGRVQFAATFPYSQVSAVDTIDYRRFLAWNADFVVPLQS